MKRVEDIFDLKPGQGIDLIKLEKSDSVGSVNFISRTAKNNGVAARVAVPKNVTPCPAGALTVSLGGSILETFLQPEPFICSQNIMVLTPKNELMSDLEKLWWAWCIRANQYRYSFGRHANRTLKHLRLPDEAPEWVHSATPPDIDEVKSSVSSNEAVLPPASEWASFRLDHLFDIRKGTRSTKQSQKPGNTPYLGASALNNSVTSWIDSEPQFPAGCIAVPYNGSVGFATYQPMAFSAGDDIHVLIPFEELSPLVQLFLCRIIREESKRYGYGRKWNLTKMKEDSIRLPAFIDDNLKPKPDWDIIERYMKSLPYSAGVLHLRVV